MNKLTLALLLTGSIATAQAITKEEASQLPQFRSNGSTPVDPQFRGGTSFTVDFAAVGPVITTGEAGSGLNPVSNCFNGDTVTGVSWSNVVIQANGASWFNEIRLQVSNSDASETGDIQFSTTGSAGNGTTENVPDQAETNFGTAVTALGDGLFNVEPFESFDDASEDPDGQINSGTVTFHGTGIGDSSNGVCNLPVELMNYEID